MAFPGSQLGGHLHDILLIVLLLFTVITISVGLYDRGLLLGLNKDAKGNVVPDENKFTHHFMIITLSANVLFLAYKLFKVGMALYSKRGM